jgi:uncharacterized protein with HEPN domain
MRTDETHLLDMLLAARKVKKFSLALTQEEFNQSELHQSAIIRELQVIGEAARLVSDETKTEHNQINWAEIAGMRNRLVHEYFRISLKVVWQVVEDGIDELITQLETILQPDPPES